MNELALFAGAGGGILGGHLLGWRTICAVERDAYAAQILAQRQNDEALPTFPIWSDVCSFDGRPWRGLVDVVSGGFPCTNISICGDASGLDGEASGLWVEQRRIIDEVRPRLAYMENSPMLTSRGLGRILGDLAELGFDARWGVLSAYDAGLDHRGTVSGLWPTPTASDGKGSVLPETARKRAEKSSRGVRLPEHLTLLGLLPGGRHNPEFSEWLMGWPLQWTDIAPLEMAKFREWQQQHFMHFPSEVAA